MDKNLQWKDHIEKITNKMSKSLGIMKKVKSKINSSTLTTLYNSLLLPYLNYCNVSWGNSAMLHLNKLHLLQKRAVRIIHNANYRAHTEELFSRSKILSIFQLFFINVCTFMYKIHHGLSPFSITGLYAFRNEIRFCFCYVP